MVDVWAVIGGEHTRKTSSIRAITGVRQIEKKWKVAYVAHGNALTYVYPHGLQENARFHQKISFRRSGQLMLIMSSPPFVIKK